MEVWKDIQGYEGIYQVSNLGRVRSLDRTMVLESGKIRRDKGVILKSIKHKTKGYCYVSLSRGGYFKRFLIHRLVAQSFLENNDNKPQVNHINGDKNNNSVENLEWCTEIENIHHAMNTGLLVRKSEQYDGMRKKIYCPELNMQFASLADASRYCKDLGYEKLSDARISECTSGKRKSIHGLTWQSI